MPRAASSSSAPWGLIDIVIANENLHAASSSIDRLNLDKAKAD
jgi:hypothetical protein